MTKVLARPVLLYCKNSKGIIASWIQDQLKMSLAFDLCATEDTGLCFQHMTTDTECALVLGRGQSGNGRTVSLMKSCEAADIVQGLDQIVHVADCMVQPLQPAVVAG